MQSSHKRKISAVQKLLATDQESTIEQIEHILSDRKPITLTKDQREMIDEAPFSLDCDGKILHDNVVGQTNKRYSKE